MTNLLEERCTIDVIFIEISPTCFKMVESFKNLDNILRGWARDRKKSLAEALTRFKKQEEER